MANEKLKTVLTSLTSVCQQLSINQSALSKLVLAKGASAEAQRTLLNIGEHQRQLSEILGTVGQMIGTLDC
jgi:hypothetical protein